MEEKLEIFISDFRYVQDSDALFKDLYITIPKGEILLLEGPVGSGKTTLLKLIAGIIPNFEQGILNGKILLNKHKIEKKTFSKTTFCFQDSDGQLIFDTVEKQFYEDQKTLQDFFKKLKLEKILDKSMNDFSKGEKKFICLLSTIRKKRQLYLFDEPLDLLDDNHKSIILESLKELSKDSLIIISSHDADINRIITKKLIWCENKKSFSESKTCRNRNSSITVNIKSKPSEEILFSCTKLSYQYENNEIIDSFPALKIGENETIGLVGQNASGKTTFLKLLSGKITPKSGKIETKNFTNFGFLTQNTNRQLFADTVEQELFINDKRPSKEKQIYGEHLLNRIHLEKLRNIHPIFLSGGQKQKLVLASLLLNKPEIIFLDEIFKNLDLESIETIFEIINEYRKKQNLAIVFTDQSGKYLEAICDKIITLPAQKF